ncbi:MAG: hypothetical protein LUG16_08715 [Candidatus Gastranaerophilales bacterium]|nr:hypothetical protein [Candidatus Gastranaerophilales bacterium]
MNKFYKYIIIGICLIFFNMIQVNPVKSEISSENLKVRAGSFIKVMVREEFSTLTSDIGDEVTFINPDDMYVYETNAIPRGTIVYGKIEDVLEPVQGRNGALKISIYKMITPDKKVYDIKGYIYGENHGYIGGEETGTMYYRKVPHYIKNIRPILQAAPLNVYQDGRHTIVKSGSELFFIPDEDIILK